MTRRPAPTRFARTVLLAVTSAALSVTAHGAAGGEITEFAGALPLTLLIAFAGTALAERGRTPWTILATLGVAQLAQHALMNLGHQAHDRSGPGFDPVTIVCGWDGLLWTKAVGAPDPVLLHHFLDPGEDA